MIGTLSIFILSILGMVALIVNHHVHKGKKKFFTQSDEYINEGIDRVRHFFKFFNKKTFSLFFHLFLEKVEEFFLKILRILKNKVRKP